MVNPFTVRQNPLAKTDKKDAVWLTTILMNGMAQPSLMVDEQQEALRDFTRQRLHYTHELTRTKNRIIRILESCNFKVMSIVSNISTKTGRQLVESLSKGVTDIEELTNCCHHSVIKRKGDILPKALKGNITINHQHQLQLLLEDWDHAERQIFRVNNAIAALFTDEQNAVIDQLDKVEGIAVESAQVIMAEMGISIGSFKNEDSAVKYAGFAAGVHQSSDKKVIVNATREINTCEQQ